MIARCGASSQRTSRRSSRWDACAATDGCTRPRSPNCAAWSTAAENDSAFELALRIEEAAPGDSTLEALWPRFSRRAVVRVQPRRARRCTAPRWPIRRAGILVGTTPTDPSGFRLGVSLFRFEKPGYRTVHSLFMSNAGLSPVDTSHRCD